MNKYTYIFLSFFCYNTTFAQQSFTNQKINSIIGRVVDSSTQHPIEYATISVADRQSKKVVRVATSNQTGFFKITDLNVAAYQISIECIGYSPKKINDIIISDVKTNISLNTIFLTVTNKTLKDITIISSKPIVENKIDKIIYNVENDITSQGSVAIDVLKKVPQVSVDIDGNVELQGDANVRFLINGKPSSAFGNSLTDALSSIPVSQIKSIEVITSPGAKYDAQGTGGIINIILKDSRLQGMNGNISLSAGTRLENTSINVGFHHNNFGISVFFSGNAQLSSHTLTSQNRTSIDTVAKTSTSLLQNGFYDFQRNGYQSGISFDWNLTKKDNINATIGYSHFDNHNTAFTNQQEITRDENATILLDTSTFRNSDNRSSINSIDCSLSYKKKLRKEGQEIDILYSGSYGTPYNNYIQTQTYKNQSIPYSGTSNNNPGVNNETDISIDYSYPITKDFLFETGAKTTFQNISSISNVSTLNTPTNQYIYIYDSTQSYNLDYKLNVYAAYISASFPLSKYLNIKAGMRDEYSDPTIYFPNTSVPTYNSLVPSLILSHNFNKNNFIKIAYSHRIERADYNALNPFVNLSDPYNITVGNPLLQPEIGNNFELGYNKTFAAGANAYIALIERINNNDVKPYTFFYPSYKIGDSTYNNVSVSTRENVGTEYNSGIVFSGSFPVGRKIHLRSNILFMQQHEANNLNKGNVIVGYKFRINLNATYQLQHNLIVELFGNYHSPVNNIQGKTPQFITYTFAFKKQLWNKKASIGFTATNPFNKYVNQVTTIITNNYNSTLIRNVPYRSFGISFTYKFGKLEFKKIKEDDTNYLNNPPD